MKSSLRDIIFWTAVAVYMVFALSFANRHHAKEYCVDIDLQLEGEVQNYFVDKHDILNLIDDHAGMVLGQHLGEIDLRTIEEGLEESSAIKNAEVFYKPGAVIGVRVEQRNPVLRIIDKQQRSYYIDQEGFVMEASKKFTARVPVANGEIDTPWELVHNRHLGELMQTADSVRVNLLSDLYTLGYYLQKNEFWNNQIQQIYLNEHQELELIPRVGAHLIVLGNLDNYEVKLRNLKAVYDKAFSKIGWNQYRTINLKFSNQVICTQRTR